MGTRKATDKKGVVNSISAVDVEPINWDAERWGVGREAFEANKQYVEFTPHNARPIVVELDSGSGESWLPLSLVESLARLRSR